MAVLDKIVGGENAPSENFIKFLNGALGLELGLVADVSVEVKELISEREVAREERDFGKADELRSKLEGMGIGVLDGASGSVWQYLK